MQSSLDQALEQTWAQFPQMAPNQIAVTWVLYEPPYRVNTGGALSVEEFWQYCPAGASYRGVELLEPAGLVGLFYLVAGQVWLEQGMVQPLPELDRAFQVMMDAGSPEAIGYVLDVLTGTTSGPELPLGPFETWKQQRNIVNRYFQQLGWPELRGLNLNQKLWWEGPFGRERLFLGETFEQRNKISAEATARLLHSIVGGVSVSAARSQLMMHLLQRADPRSEVGQVQGRWGLQGVETPSLRLWAIDAQGNQGYLPRVYHQAAYLEVDGLHPFLLVVLTEGLEPGQQLAGVNFLSQQLLAQPLLKKVAK